MKRLSRDPVYLYPVSARILIHLLKIFIFLGLSILHLLFILLTTWAFWMENEYLNKILIVIITRSLL